MYMGKKSNKVVMRILNNSKKCAKQLVLYFKTQYLSHSHYENGIFVILTKAEMPQTSAKKWLYVYVFIHLFIDLQHSNLIKKKNFIFNK